MRKLRVQGALFLAMGLALSGASAMAQRTVRATDVGSVVTTDVAVSGYEAFTAKVTDSAGDSQSLSNAPGGIVEFRRLVNPLIGLEGTYSFNQANQTYKELTTCPSGTCSSVADVVKANAHEISIDWVPSLKLTRIRAFGVVGVGLLLNVPSSGQSGTQSATKPVFVYGAGVDYGLGSRFGLRLQGRGNLYSAPDLTKLYTSFNKFTQTAEPVFGIYFRL